MSASIMRPWIPPASLISLTKSLMALVCSLYSTSPANPKFDANAERLDTGKTTRMLWALTPALEVLAWTGLATVSVVVEAPGLADDPLPTATAMPTTRTATTATEVIWMLAGRRRNRRHDRPNRPPPGSAIAPPSCWLSSAAVSGPPPQRQT